MRCVAGIDYSLSCPALCVHVGDEWSQDNCHFFYLYGVSKWIRNDKNLTSQKFDPYLFPEERLNSIASFFVHHLKQFKPDCVFIENYSYTSHSSSTHILAEGCGVLKHKIWSEHFIIQTLPVTAIKKFATGKGNATKEGMCRAFDNEGSLLGKMLPCQIGKSPLADLVDAYFIAKMGFSQKR